MSRIKGVDENRPVRLGRRLARADRIARGRGVAPTVYPFPGRRAATRGLALLTVIVAGLGALALAVSAPPSGAKTSHVRPTVVLVHGAFADASSWSGVIVRLLRDGYRVIAPANPLRGLAYDAAYVASVLKTVKGPVVLVGHSYAGAVIGQAAADLPNVKALVFVDGFALDTGESITSAGAAFTNDLLGSALLERRFPLPDGQTATDVYVQPSRYHAVMGADLPEATTALLAATQRPIALSAFDEKATAAAWKTIPSVFVIGRQDRAIDPAELLFMAHRAHGRVVELQASHLGLISHVGAVAKVIEQAAR